MNQRGHLRLDGQVWRLSIRVADAPGARRVRKSIKLGTLEELSSKTAARRAADRILRQLSPRELHAGAAVSWHEWCDEYHERHLVLLAANTRTTRASIIDRHLRGAKPLAGKQLHEIDEHDCQAFVTDQVLAGVAPSTVRARFAVLRRMLRAAEARGLTVTPPRADRTEFPRELVVSDSVRSKAFSTEEVVLVLRYAPEPLRTICALCRYAGLRASEALGLRWSAIDLEAGVLEVREQALCGELRPLKSRSSAAQLPIQPPLHAALTAYRAAWAPNPRELLFATDGQPLEAAAVRDELHELLDRLGIRRRGLHGFRHACALAMAAAGVNPEALRRAMRHASLRVTAVYLSATSADVHAALAAGSGGAGLAQVAPDSERILPRNAP